MTEVQIHMSIDSDIYRLFEANKRGSRPVTEHEVAAKASDIPDSHDSIEVRADSAM